MDWLLFATLVAVFEIGPVVQGFASYLDGYFDARQMLEVHNIKHGDAFVQHGGMWADMLIIGPLMAYILASGHHVPLRSSTGVITLVVCSVVWLALIIMFAKASTQRPEAHAHDGRLTFAGAIHLLYAIAGTDIIALFYISHPSMRELIIVSAVLTPFFHLGVRKFNKDWQWNPGAWAMTIGGPIAVWGMVLTCWIFGLHKG